jgi:hypothetical protein
MGWFDNVKDWFSNINFTEILIPSVFTRFMEFLLGIGYIILDILILIFVIAFMLFFFAIQYYIIKFYIWIVKNIISQIPIIKDFVIVKIINKINNEAELNKKTTLETD